MRDVSVCALTCLAFVSGCFAPNDDATAPAPNYNPAPSETDVPRGSGGRSTDAAPSRGSGSISKDFEGLTPEKLQENDEEKLGDGDSDAARTQASDEKDDESVKPDEDYAAAE